MRKIIDAVIEKMTSTGFSTDKLGGPGLIVEFDEIILNYKCKGHRGRSPTNKIDALCIAESRGSRKRVFASTITDKKASKLYQSYVIMLLTILLYVRTNINPIQRFPITHTYMKPYVISINLLQKMVLTHKKVIMIYELCED